MTQKGILYFGRPYLFPEPGQAEAAELALENIASGAKTGAVLTTREGRILVTAHSDVVLFDR